MFDTILGLPVHPLVIHGVVVLAPLTALLAVAYAFRPTWRVGLRWPTVGLGAVSALLAFTATQSGEALEHRIGDPAYDHAEKGDLAAISVYVLFGVILVMVFLLAKAGADAAQGMAVAAMVLSVLAAGFLTFAVTNAGHSGAKSAWYDVVKSTTPNSGESGESGDDD